MTAATQARPVHPTRPNTISTAIALCVINAVASIALLPLVNGVDGFVVGVTIGFSVLFLLGAWGLWNASKWAGIGVFIVSAVNGLISFGSIFSAPEGSPDTLDRVLGVIGVLFALLICGLLIARESRQALR